MYYHQYVNPETKKSAATLWMEYIVQVGRLSLSTNQEVTTCERCEYYGVVRLIRSIRLANLSLGLLN